MIFQNTRWCGYFLTPNELLSKDFVATQATKYYVKSLLKNTVVIFLFLVIIGCGDGRYVENHDNAINAVNVLNKNQYRILSENKNREPVSFQVTENVAYMNGVMDSTIPLLIENLVRNYPEVDTIVMGKVLGTIDFSATLEAGRLVREYCLTTVVPSHGKVTSGGVHFFLGGCKRIVESGGKLGIHTWKYAKYDEAGNIIGGKTAVDYPLESEEHKIYLDYHADMEIPEEFYWFVVNTPFDNMHFLTQNEMRLYEISTFEPQIWGSNYRLVINKNQLYKFKTARFYVKDDVAIMHGNISERTPFDFVNMLKAHPEVQTLEFGIVTGTLLPHTFSAINFGFAIRDSCIKTKISQFSYVLAEAVHSFISGCGLEFEAGGQLGLASWVKGDIADHTMDGLHSEYIDLYDEIGISHSFYFHQLEISSSQPEFIDINGLMNHGVM